MQVIDRTPTPDETIYAKADAEVKNLTIVTGVMGRASISTNCLR